MSPYGVRYCVIISAFKKNLRYTCNIFYRYGVSWQVLNDCGLYAKSYYHTEPLNSVGILILWSIML
jgi:hypothetical protein